jgi:hypothetical protein
MSGDLKKKISLSDLSIAKLYIYDEKLIALVSDKYVILMLKESNLFKYS